ncbi:ankyrin repeat domain-containing protein [Candidatus Dependentiae bacterium]|nr:ankyrin repeat domain-containing protein [Candidatus Dependentiae bacterium]
MFKQIGLMSLFGLVMIAHSSYAVGIEVVPRQMWEQSNNEEKILEHIFAQGSSINATYRYSDAKTGAHHAAKHGYTKVLEFFLDNGCAVDDLDRSKHTPLVCAVAYGQHASIVTLVKRGADLRQMTPKGATLADLARQNDYNTLGTCIEQVLNGTWDIDFLVGLLNQFKSVQKCFCHGPNCQDESIIMTNEGIAPEQYEIYMNALENCGISPERQNPIIRIPFTIIVSDLPNEHE